MKLTSLFIKAILIVLFSSIKLFGQIITYSFQPGAVDGKDAIISSSLATTNYGNSSAFNSQRTASGERIRGLIQFNLAASTTTIPSNAIILSASLTLANTASQSGTNTSFLAKITNTWSETGVTWNNINTSFSTADRISIPSTTLSTLSIDVKNHVQNFVNIPNSNNGWMLYLQNEASGTQLLSYISSDGILASYRPRINISYVEPMKVTSIVTPASSATATNGAVAVTVTCGIAPYTYSWSNGATTSSITNVASGMYTLTVTDSYSFQVRKIISVSTGATSVTAEYQPDALAGEDAYYGIGDNGVYFLNANISNQTTYTAIRGTASGWFKTRSAIKFDLSHIPKNATVHSATLSLYGVNHNTIGMSNASFLSRFTSPWHENTIAWLLGGPPPTTTVGAVSIPATTSSTENRFLNVTSHIQSMVSDPANNHGWEIKLQNEGPQLYACMGFGSSDDATPSRRPKLTISYSYPCPTSLSITTTPSVNVCAGSTRTLSVATNTNVSFTWAGPGIVSTNPYSAVVNQSGTYTVTASYGCGTATTNIAFNPNPNANSGPSRTITCTSPTVTLNGSSSTSGVSFSWTPGGSSQTSSVTNVSTANTYTLKVTNNSTQCFQTSTVLVTTNTVLPNASAGPNRTIACSSPTVTLNGSSSTSGVTFSWTPAGSSPTSSVTNVSAANTYTLRVTNISSGCFQTSSVSVVTNTIFPNVNAGSTKTITTANPTVTLIGSSSTPSVTYLWNPAGSSPTTATTNVTSGGVYTLTVSNPVNGCTSTSTVLVIVRLTATALVQDYENDTLLGSVSLNVSGGVPPYNIAWNGVKLPSASIVYNAFLNTVPGFSVDSFIFKQKIDSIKEVANYKTLEPGNYQIKIFSQLNDSIKVIAKVGSNINDWLFTNGVSISTVNINPINKNDTTYIYGKGKSITTQGTYTSNGHYAVPSALIDLNETNEIVFSVPNITDILYAGIQQQSLTITGDTSDLNQKSMFKFNGNGTFNVIYNSSVIYSGNVNPNDAFKFKINPNSNLFQYYKNETLLVETDYSALNNSVGYLPKFVLGNVNATFTGVKFIFPTKINLSLYPSISKQLNDALCENNCGGEIKLSATVTSFGQAGVFTLPDHTPFINNNSSTVNYTFSNLCVGSYIANYQYPRYNFATGTYQLTNISVPFEVAYMPNWVNVINSSPGSPNNSLTKSMGGNGNWDAGATSLNTLLASNSGWIEWTVNSNYAVNGIGFKKALSNPPANYNPTITEIDYGMGYAFIPFYNNLKVFVMTQNNTIINSLILTSNPSGNFQVNDVFRLTKNGTTVTLRKNNQTIGSLSGISNADNYNLYASLQTFGGKIFNPRTSFGCIAPKIQYVTLKKELEGNFYDLNLGNLSFKYDEEYVNNNNNLKFNIYDKNRTVIYSNSSSGGNLVVNFKDNWYTLNLGNISPVIPTGFYVMEVENKKGEIYKLRFKK